MKTLSELIKEIALGEVGVREIGTSNSGQRVKEYQASTGLKGTGWPWCAAFICWVVRQAMYAQFTAGAKGHTFKRPQTAAAYGFDEWSLAQDDSTKTFRKHPGADYPIGIFSLRSTSHCGIATSAPNKNGDFKTVEGNTNAAGSRDGGGVMVRVRNVRDVRDFIAFTV